ncbi:MAG: oligosaccharide repeat unit polymerase [Verrucomicrobia bacterium]|nr:oligosaccharide repeat unit polymerase [Verrucomicrobiota bacterium]
MTSEHISLTKSGTHWAPAVGFVFLAPLMFVGIFEPSFFLISLSAVIMGIVTVPFLRTRQIDWFSPWNWMFYGVFIGVFVRAIYITFDIPDSDRINDIFLLGRSKDFLLVPMLMLLIGMGMMTFGYLAGPGVSRKISYKIFQSDNWAEKRFWVVVIVLQLLSFIGLYLYIKNTTGQISMDNISRYRGLSTDLGEYKVYGYLRWLVNLSDIAYCLLLVKMVSERRVYFKKITAFLAFVISSTTSLFFYFFVQTRGGFAVWLLNIVVIIYYLRNKKFPLFKFAILFLFVLISVRYMTGLRAGNRFDQFSMSDFNVIHLFEPVILGLNGIDVSKTAHIMAAIPEYLDYQYGATLFRIVYLWIPRQLWPAKPVNVDTTVGMAVFGAETYGTGAVPPGLIAEMYWNFWIPGIIVGCFAAGYLLKIIYTQFKRYDTNRNVVILYATCFMSIGGGLLGSGFSSELLGFLMTFLPVVIVLNIITKRNKYMPDKFMAPVG